MSINTYYSNATIPDPLIGSYDIKNIYLAHLQNRTTNTLTLTIQTKSITTPNSSNKATIAFPNIADGSFSSVDITSNITIDVPSGADLGLGTAGSKFIYVWALNNAGVVELALSGSRVWEDGSTQSTTAISVGSTSSNVLYSTASRSSKSIRLIAIITVQFQDGFGLDSMVVNLTPQRLHNLWSSVTDTKGINVSGGTFTSGSFQSRTITNSFNTDRVLQPQPLASQISLPAGTYKCYIAAVAFGVDGNKTRLRNITASSTLVVGTNENSNTGGTVCCGYSILNGIFTLTVQSTLEVQHVCITTRATTGFGTPTNFTDSEVYLSGTILRIH